MNPISIGFATRAYQIASKCEIIRHRVDHAELFNTSRMVQSLAKSLEADNIAEEDYWRQTLGPVRHLVFVLCSTPLPFNRAAEASRIDWIKLDRQVRQCQQLYPDSHTTLSDLVQKVRALSEEACSPFTKPLELLCRKNDEVSVIIRNPRMNQTVAAYFATNALLQHVKIVSERQLREAHMCEALIVFGPCKWFSDYVFLAPRAQCVHVMSFRWMYDLWKLEPVFLSGTQSNEDKSYKHSIGILPKFAGLTTLPNSSLPNLDPQDLLPPMSAFRKEMLYKAGWQPSSSDELVSAKYCVLSGRRAVFVPANESAKQIIIDPAGLGDSIVRRVPVNALEPDFCLLLRTSGGGDLIVPLADRILGNLAKKRRTQQAEWKERLIASAQHKFGTLSRRELASNISNFLRKVGLSMNPSVNISISPAQIHYWMSSKSIRPSKEDDFTVILAFSGMADRTKELWEAMEEIDRAHRRAGHTIRKMLLQRIFSTSLEPLERDGEMIFDLGEQGGGTLSAFQITHISEKEHEIAVSLIGVLLDLEE